MESSRKIGRFQIMGLLQAARYFILHNDLEKAKSFGINRAIFYAWAKHHKKYYPKHKEATKSESLAVYSAGIRNEPKIKAQKIAGEEIFVDEKTGLFIIGDKPNTPRDFDDEIARKINIYYPFDLAWKSALEYVSSFSKEILQDQRDFYEKVYLPVRDNFEAIIKRKKVWKNLFDNSYS